MPLNTGPYQQTFQAPAVSRLFTPAVRVLLVLLVAGFVLVTYAPDFTVSFLALTLNGISRGALWQLLTYSLVNPGASLVMSLLATLFLGSTVEREWGTRRFVSLWAVVSVGCGLLFCLVSLITGSAMIGLGTTPCIYGLLAAFGIMLRGQRLNMFFVTVAAHHLALILVALGIILSITQPINLIWIAGAGVAYAFVKLGRRSGPGLRPSGRPRRDAVVDIE